MVNLAQLYRTVWRWHFYAGLVVAPVLLIMAVTGSIYLFKPQFEAWYYHDLRTVQAPADAVRLPACVCVQPTRG